MAVWRASGWRLSSSLRASAFAADARDIHERILTLDTHMDTPMNFARPGWDIMDAHSVAGDLSQVDYPRMVKGGLDGGFFAIYTPQGPRTPEGFAAARNAALKRGGGNPRNGGAPFRQIRACAARRRRSSHRRLGQAHRLR